MVTVYTARPSAKRHYMAKRGGERSGFGHDVELIGE